MRFQPKPKSFNTTTKLLFATAALVVVWCITTPILLLSQMQDRHLHTAQSLLQQKPSGEDIPLVVPTGSGLWTLENATEKELRGKNWYEKGNLIVRKNLVYLLESKGRASQVESNITLVSGMFDLGRGDLPDSFKRTFQQYVERFSNFLAYKFPKILFIQPEHYQYYLPYLEQNPDYPVYIVNTTIDDIRAFAYYNEVQKMRNKPGWAQQAGWLAESPQASMPLYNPMVMSKLLWTRDAARINPFNTDGFLWIDGGHQCNNPTSITMENDYTFKKHFDKVLITYFDYEPYREVHGFEAKAFKRYCNTKDKIVRVGRGGIFGGTKEYLEVASEIYLLALGETLNAGYMGTEENIFSILYYRFPELVSDYENGEGGNCAIFSEAIYGPPPPPIEEVVQMYGFDLRGLKCVGSYDDITCYDGNTRCPSYVTPLFLSAADDQYTCNLRGYYCTSTCIGDQIFWYSHTCPEEGQCPPYGRVPYSEFYEAPEPSHHVHALPVPQKTQNIPLSQTSVGEEEEFTKQIQRSYSDEDKKFLQKNGYDLRGLECEILDGEEVCFLNHRLGRDICPPDINSLVLTKADGQWACQAGTEDTYCTAVCQDGTPFIRWTAYNTQWCLENPDSCAPKPDIILYDNFVLRHWSEPEKEAQQCDSKLVSDFSSLPPFTVGVLARGTELESLHFALESWSKGFMQYVPEFLFFINDYSEEIQELLQPFTEPPFNAKILSSPRNEGILNGIRYLIGNATFDHFLFLEKDFRLVESVPCALDQIQAGFDLLLNDKADVVKYRSRYNGGKPNWADILYRDHEEDVFERQPNLLCNFYHWIDHPEQVWPQHFKICNDDPIMYCVDAEFCNWTNNPFFIHKDWWIENYEKKHWEIRNQPEGFDLETWMNWHEGAWNNRGWTIAEGDGMFKHADVNKFGV